MRLHVIGSPAVGRIIISMFLFFFFFSFFSIVFVFLFPLHSIFYYLEYGLTVKFTGFLGLLLFYCFLDKHFTFSVLFIFSVFCLFSGFFCLCARACVCLYVCLYCNLIQPILTGGNACEQLTPGRFNFTRDVTYFFIGLPFEIWFRNLIFRKHGKPLLSEQLNNMKKTSTEVLKQKTDG